MIEYRVIIEHQGSKETTKFDNEVDARSFADEKEKDIYHWYKEIDNKIPFRGKFKKDADKLAYKNEVHLYRISSDLKSKITYQKIDYTRLFGYGKK